jgi:hypothetical protein
LSDGTSVQVDQLIIAGAGLSAFVGSGPVGAQIDDTDLAVIISTEIGGAGRSWVSAQSNIASAQIAGYSLADLNSGSLLLNSEILNGALVTDGTRPVIDWNGANDDTSTQITVVEGQVATFEQDARTLEIGVDGMIKLGAADLSGDFTVALVTSDTGDKAWHITAQNVNVGVSAEGARAGISDGSGELWIGKNDATGVFGANERSGVIIGTAEITGVTDLTASGTLQAEFDTTGNLILSGAVDIDVAGYAVLNGQFAFEKGAVNTAEPVKVLQPVIAGGTGSASETQKGGQKTATTFGFNVSETDAEGTVRTREGTYAFAYNGTTVELGLQRAQSDAEWRSRLDTALEVLFGYETTEVTGTKADGFVVSLGGPLNGTVVSGLTMTAPVDPAIRNDWGSNYISARGMATTGPVHLTDKIPTTNVEGGLNFEFEFNVTQNASFMLATVTNGDDFREGTYGFAYGGNDVSVQTTNRQGQVLSDVVVLGKLQSQLAVLFGDGNVLVSGTRAAGFGIDIVGDLAGEAIAVDGANGFVMTPPLDGAGLVDLNDTGRLVTNALTASASTSYKLIINAPRGATNNSDEFQLSFENGQTTRDITLVSVQDNQSRQIYDMLAELMDIDVSGKKYFGSASTTYDSRYASSLMSVSALPSPLSRQEYTITFQGEAATKALNWGVMSVAKVDNGASDTDDVSYELGVNGTVGQPAQPRGAVHFLAGYDASVTGNFTLSFDYEGATYTIADIDMQADANAVQMAIAAATAGATTFTSTGATVAVVDQSNGWQISFAGAALGVPIDVISRTATPTPKTEVALTQEVAGRSTSDRYRTNLIDFAVFNSDADAIAAALLGAEKANGASLADAGVTVDVTLDTASDQWRIVFGGAAVGQDIDVMRSAIDAREAPEAILERTAVGSTTDETQSLSIAASGAIQVGYLGQVSDILDAATLTATQLQDALVGLAGLNAGDVTVSQTGDGTFDVVFGGMLAGQDVADIQVTAVVAIDLMLPADGEIADVVYLRAVGDTTWTRTIEVPKGATTQARTCNWADA